MSANTDDANDRNGDHKDTKDTKNDRDRANELSNVVIGAAIEVHRIVGPGLLESAYEECLGHELQERGIAIARQVPVPLTYKGLVMGCAYRLDLLVEGVLVVEVKCVDRLDRIHTAQVLTYLRMHQLWLGLLINFNVPILKSGIKRVVRD